MTARRVGCMKAINARRPCRRYYYTSDLGVDCIRAFIAICCANINGLGHGAHGWQQLLTEKRTSGVAMAVWLLEDLLLAAQREFFSPNNRDKLQHEQLWKEEWRQFVSRPMLSLYEHAPGIVSHFHGANHRSSSWEELVSEIAGVDGFQEFLAGDLSCDMLDSPVFNGGMPVSRTFHDLNDWVYIGPGCRIGTPAGEVSPSFGEMLFRYVCVCVQTWGAVWWFKWQRDPNASCDML